MTDKSERKISLTQEQQAQLRELRGLAEQKIAEIAKTISRDLGFGDFADLDETKQKQVMDEVEQVIDRWEDDVEMNRKEPSTHSKPTPLQRLLNEHNDLDEQILDILEEAAGQG